MRDKLNWFNVRRMHIIRPKVRLEYFQRMQRAQRDTLHGNLRCNA